MNRQTADQSGTTEDYYYYYEDEDKEKSLAQTGFVHYIFGERLTQYVKLSSLSYNRTGQTAKKKLS